MVGGWVVGTAGGTAGGSFSDSRTKLFRRSYGNANYRP